MCNDDALDKLIGKTLSAVQGKEGEDVMIFTLEDGSKFRMHHYQDCCEYVDIYDITGDMSDLVGSPILQAEEVQSENNPSDVKMESQDSFTWTFYKFATLKGYVTIRWYGESNGYYSEDVTCKLLECIKDKWIEKT